MNDNALVQNIISVLSAGMTAQSVTVGIKQGYQPTQQGAPSAATIFLHKIADNRYGYPQRIDTYNAPVAPATIGTVTHTETQDYETTFQVNATAYQDPNNTTELTASDYVNTAAMILASDFAVSTLNAVGVGILRIQKLQQTFFRNDKGQFESDPSFSFVITHSRVTTWVQPATLTITGEIFVVDGGPLDTSTTGTAIWDQSSYDSPSVFGV